MPNRVPVTPDLSPRRVGVRELRGQLSSLLREVQAGRHILVMSHNEVLAELRPPARPDAPVRRPGAMRGRIRMAEDFDTLPDDLLAAMEGDGE